MSPGFLRVLRGCASILLLVQTALSADTAGPLTLQDAIQHSLERNLDLKAFDYELEAQRGRVQEAGARPPMEVQTLVENVAGSGARGGFDAAETTLSLAWTLERGALERRLNAANAGGDLLGTEGEIRRLDLAAETARRFVSVLERQQELAQLRQATQLSQETLKAVQLRVKAAKAPLAEEARALAQLARVQLDAEHAAHELAADRQRLAAMWGDTRINFGEALGQLATLPTLEPFETVRTRIENSSDLDRLVSEKRLRESEVRLAEIRRRPAWQIHAGVRRLEDGNDHAFVVGLNVPLPSRGQAQGALTTARARSAQVDAESAALRVRLDVELFGLYQELQHAYTEVATLRDTVLPSMETAAEKSRYAYERGRYGYAEWISAQRELMDLRRALLAAYADVHRHRIEIEHLTGVTLNGQFIQ